MPWRNIGEEVEVKGRARLFWQLEWAEYTSNPEAEEYSDKGFLEIWSGVTGAGVPVTAASGGELAVNEGHKVVRRLRVVEEELVYPGLTRAAALAKAKAFFSDANYMGAEMIPNGAGGWRVEVTRRVYDPDGWSQWIDEALLPQSGGDIIETEESTE